MRAELWRQRGQRVLKQERLKPRRCSDYLYFEYSHWTLLEVDFIANWNDSGEKNGNIRCTLETQNAKVTIRE